MTDLPSDLIEDILRRLPVKSLKRFRAVAKPWCSLIDSDRFAKLHLCHSLNTLSNRHLITGGGEIRTVALDSLDKAHDINPPANCKRSDEISHSCNGVVLVKSEPPVLWNPFSRDYKVLPHSPVECAAPADSYTRIRYDFGYDSRNDDYKVIRFVEFRHVTDRVLMAEETKIYGLKSNSWRRIDCLPYDQWQLLRSDWLPPNKLKLHVHVNGVLHTIVEDPNNVDGARIMCFSLETEMRYPMMMPRGIKIMSFDDVCLDVIGDYLSVVCSNRYRVVIWVMKEYGVVDSWVKLEGTIRGLTCNRSDFVKPLVCSKEGDRVLLNCNENFLVWYDLRKESVDRLLCVDGLPFPFYAEAIVESLVSFDGGRGEIKNWGQEKEKRKERIRKKRDGFLSEGFKLVL